jgi:4-aminobutyrate aminotransferase-like enzyme
MKFNRFRKNGKTFQNYDVVPDIVVMGKRNGWRNACGRFTASTEMMDLLSDNPKLGHITTFGAPCHCVSLFSYITETDLMDRTLDKKTV